MTAGSPRVAVMQDGARLHYALPLALQHAGLLDTMFTDWFAGPGSRSRTVAALLARFAPAPGQRALGQRLLGRQCPGLDPAQVAASPFTALRVLLARLHDDPPEVREARLARWMAARVGRHGWGGANCLMGFVRNVDPRLYERAQAAGLLTVVDQMIAPAEVEHAAMLRQAARWPAWAPGIVRPSLVIEAERRTWQAADHITCPSDYVRDGLLQQGMPPGKVSVIPYPIDAGAWEVADRCGRAGPVTVGFIGAVGLRKGAPAVFELARLFDPARVRFVMVGPVQAPPAVLASAGPVVLTGPVPRADVRAHLRGFDVFLLPSACEGSAGAVMEAMASGLPVVTTPSAGTPVRDGVEGFVRDAGDIAGLQACLARLAGSPDLRRDMGLAARQRAEGFSIAHYADLLQALLRRLVQDKADAHGATMPLRPGHACSLSPQNDTVGAFGVSR